MSWRKTTSHQLIVPNGAPMSVVSPAHSHDLSTCTACTPPGSWMRKSSSHTKRHRECTQRRSAPSNPPPRERRSDTNDLGTANDFSQTHPESDVFLGPLPRGLDPRRDGNWSPYRSLHTWCRRTSRFFRSWRHLTTDCSRSAGHDVPATRESSLRQDLADRCRPTAHDCFDCPQLGDRAGTHVHAGMDLSP